MSKYPVVAGRESPTGSGVISVLPTLGVDVPGDGDDADAEIDDSADEEAGVVSVQALAITASMARSVARFIPSPLRRIVGVGFVPVKANRSLGAIGIRLEGCDPRDWRHAG